MKRVLILSALAAALMTSACITVIDASDSDDAWHGNNAQPFDAARDQCRAEAGNRHNGAFRDCMAAKGWTRS
jgi:opacity protein-like surface antigen